jgi:hypothetical protein
MHGKAGRSLRQVLFSSMNSHAAYMVIGKQQSARTCCWCCCYDSHLLLLCDAAVILPFHVTLPCVAVAAVHCRWPALSATRLHACPTTATS